VGLYKKQRKQLLAWLAWRFEIALGLCILGMMVGSGIMLSIFIGILSYYGLGSLIKLELKRLNDLSSLE
jgi:uncharacterized integral membrane protein